MRDSDLDDLFSEARLSPPEPSEALMARVLADAMAEQPRPAPLARSAPRRSRWAAMLAGLGGGGVLAGLATATLAGVWIGVAQPATVSEALWQGTAEQLDSVDLLPAFDVLSNIDIAAVEG